jgi:hypothetical protein
MGQPIWSTPAGSLATVNANTPVSIQLLASSDNGTSISYALNGGSLPTGIKTNPFSLSRTGLITGTPDTVITNTTSEFTVRVTDTNGSIRDRTFSLTVNNSGTPKFTTPSGSIANVLDSTWVNIQISYSSPSTTIPVYVSVQDGILPPGLEINEHGLIRGYPLPPLTETTNLPTVRTYAFTLKLTSTLGTDTALYSITVRNQSLTNPPNSRQPTILNTQPLTFKLNDSDPYFGYYTSTDSLGTFASGNDFIFKMIGYDFDGNALQYQFSNMPPGLVGNTNTGWITGTPTLSTIGVSTYQFSVRAYKKNNPAIASELFTFFVTIAKDISPVITWFTPSSMGSVFNGIPSELFVKAVADLPLSYRLISGSLPPNLTLLDTGELAGRVAEIPYNESSNSTQVATSISYDSLAYDIAEFDSSSYVNTNFGNVFQFVIEAYNPNYPTVKSQKQFTVSVSQEFPNAFESLYIKAMPSFTDRAKINSLLNDTSLIPDEYLYRDGDSFFGKASNVVYQHAYGMNASSLQEYLSAVSKNHYNKMITLGELKTAVAKDDNGNVIYEVVYSEIIDNLVNPKGTSIQKEIVWPKQITIATENFYTSSTVIYASSGYNYQGVLTYYTSLNPKPIQLLYPNSLVNMRQQVVNELGQNYNYRLLPRWMTSQQSNGITLGFTQAWVICYTKPGYSETVKNNINNNWAYKLNQINFSIDRFEVDKSATYNFNTVTQSWISLPSATPEPNPIDSKDFYVLFPQKTILPNVA